MLTELVESSSHHREFKRRGSFFLFTLASYVLLLIVAGVVSIVAYEAQLVDRTTETVLTMLPPRDISPSEPIRTGTTLGGGHGGGGNNSGSAGAKERMATVDYPEAPDTISTSPNPGLPNPNQIRLGDGGPGFGDGPGKGEPGGEGGALTGIPIVIELDERPPTPKFQKPPQVIRKNVINSEAISLPKPPYPPLALRTGIKGPVSIQVLIDETGKVISAKPLSGSPLLVHAAVTAAYKARFSPTFIGDQPVRVSGVITYNFVID